MHNFSTLNIDGFDFRVLDVTGSGLKEDKLIVTTEPSHLNRLKDFTKTTSGYSFLICSDEADLEREMVKIYAGMSQELVMGADDE